MNARSTTEELINKCFRLPLLEYYQGRYCYYKFALAARKFVKEENHRKANETHEKFLRWCRKNPTVDEKGVKLPKHWGQLKVNGRWL